MKIFLAGCENLNHHFAASLVGAKNILFSYYHMSKKKSGALEIMNRMNEFNQEVICDSGLFTLMFGAGKGGNYDLEYMKAYTKTYISIAKTYGIKNLTIVESDVHKLLGMPAVFELRKYFEDSGMKVLYVWHREEGIDGLLEMAKRYEYIAISVPELRILFKGNDSRYQTAVKDLLNRIKSNVKVLPKIHLLGNTVHETMETNLAYSCDSTSWLAGAQYSKVIIFKDNRLKMAYMRGRAYEGIRREFEKTYPDIIQTLKKNAKTDKAFDYSVCVAISAFSYLLYQNFLDKNFKWEGLYGLTKNDSSGSNRKDSTQLLESEPAN